MIYAAEVAEMVTEAIGMAEHKPASAVMADNTDNIPVPEGHIAYDDYVGGKSEKDPVKDFTPHIYDEVVRMCTSVSRECTGSSGAAAICLRRCRYSGMQPRMLEMRTF